MQDFYHTLNINKMDTQLLTHSPHSDIDSEDSESADRLYRAYGREVKDLLSQSDAETWIEDLWDMYTGFTFFSQEAGMIREVTTGLFLSKSWCVSFRILEK
jgi:hypothetical protein